jgi:hypothetical protein
MLVGDIFEKPAISLVKSFLKGKGLATPVPAAE